ncbi:hypothetical protein FDP41_005032 [Naegleria fowleri]|uniref:Uncharacterized protein n=1 Tax=Naegleria fowleri TaxID=5763 RepID=A0A6A5BQJ0_NAEFO|nr:uncharacterized protein FDP41_005032 [Naegleria fowleri]KAF0975705.1 hypothetical protein FDP41_005032 [Naegleria fowleri]
MTENKHPQIVEGEDSEQEEFSNLDDLRNHDDEEEAPQEIEGEDDEEDDDEEEAETSVAAVVPNQQPSNNHQPLTSSSSAAAAATTVPSHDDEQPGAAAQTISNQQTLQETESGNNIQQQEADDETNNTSSSHTTTSSAITTPVSSPSFSSLWKSFKSNVIAATTTFTGSASSSAVTQPQATPMTPFVDQQQQQQPQLESNVASSLPSQTQLHSPVVQQDPLATPNTTTPSTPSSEKASGGSPSYSTYFSGVLNKLKSELQVATLAEPVEKLKKAFTGEITHPESKNPNAIPIRVTTRIKELKQYNEQLESLLHNKYHSALEHVNVELTRLGNGMGRTYQTVQNVQTHLKRSVDNLATLSSLIYESKQHLPPLMTFSATSGGTATQKEVTQETSSSAQPSSSTNSPNNPTSDTSNTPQDDSNSQSSTSKTVEVYL